MVFSDNNFTKKLDILIAEAAKEAEKLAAKGKKNKKANKGETCLSTLELIISANTCFYVVLFSELFNT